MAPITNSRALFNSFATGYPEPGKTVVYDTTQKIDLENVVLNGGFLVKTLVLSIDPYLRERMDAPEKASHNWLFTLGLQATESGSSSAQSTRVSRLGTTFMAIPHEEYFVKKNMEWSQVVHNEHNLPWSVYIGAAGMPGQTAYYGWREFSKAKKGEVAFVTSGGGPVGSLVIQLAKADGMKVIASAGSDEKVEFMKSIGADVAFNYKTTNTRAVLEKEGRSIYWDNVGGESLEAALDAAASGAVSLSVDDHRVQQSISHQGEPHCPTRFENLALRILSLPSQNLMHIVAKSLTISGFVYQNFHEKYGEEFYATIPAKLASGELKYTEEVTRGLDKVGDVNLQC
ncbi:hypothetical protein BD779DRAFT_1675208 [Infundibulicybe gibba]|nr:hypothetical protein BD779DRAFT_1675208 [Infundibulicybe gibba]